MSDSEYFEERYGETKAEHTCPVCGKVEIEFCRGWELIERIEDGDEAAQHEWDHLHNEPVDRRICDGLGCPMKDH